MKAILGIIALMFAFSVQATDVCNSGKVVYYGDLINDAGSEKLCVVPLTNTWYFGSKDLGEAEYEYAIAQSVKPFVHTDGIETLKGYELMVENQKVVLAVVFKENKITKSLIATNRGAMEFKPENTLYLEHK